MRYWKLDQKFMILSDLTAYIMTNELQIIKYIIVNDLNGDILPVVLGLGDIIIQEKPYYNSKAYGLIPLEEISQQSFLSLFGI